MEIEGGQTSLVSKAWCPTKALCNYTECFSGLWRNAFHCWKWDCRNFKPSTGHWCVFSLICGCFLLEIGVGPGKIILVPGLLNLNALLRKDVWTVELFIFVQRDHSRSTIYNVETNVSRCVFPSSKSDGCQKNVVESSWVLWLFPLFWKMFSSCRLWSCTPHHGLPGQYLLLKQHPYNNNFQDRISV